MGGEAREWLDEARAAAMQVQELSSAIAASAGTIEADPGRLQSLEQRHSRVNDLKRRYGGSVAAALAFAGRVRERLDRLAAGAERAAELEKAVADARRRVKEEGQRLSEARAKAVGRLARAVTVELRDLGFSHGVFSVAQRAVEPQPSGMDEVEFGFAPNAGEPARPLRAIASSGEISRVMLATKTVLAAVDCIPVLVFDEIDANVGGEMGTAIGRKLARIAGSRQVLCITHLPQVAAQGEAHYVVDKQVRAGRTTTGIRPVDGEARIEEVARMLGGRDLTSVTLRHARELLASCAAGG
jgi:DNA repair protein RecN (Recombination protein N)